MGIRTLVESRGGIELYRDGEALEIAFPGGRMIRSDRRRSERSLAELAISPWAGRDDIAVVVAGLGMGFLLRAVLDQPGVRRVDVVEMSQPVIDWQPHFAKLNGDATADKRVKVHAAELGDFVKDLRLHVSDGPDGWHSVILDLDEGPDHLTRAENGRYYPDDGIRGLEPLLRGGGVLATWSAGRATDFLKRINTALQNVAEIAVPVEIEGSPLDYIYRGRRPPPAAGRPPSPTSN
jgi:spermidine synthase